MDRSLKRYDGRTIIHFDYDCFYASVVEAENPTLKSLPLAIQQKQIIVTCNYEARRRGLYKLQKITEAKRLCPDVVIVLGEDLTRFRDASKTLYNFLRSRIWSDKAEKLGFDEVFLDCSDMIYYNLELLNLNDLQHSFFHLDKSDPTCGFGYDATAFMGPVYPEASLILTSSLEKAGLTRRLILGSHLGFYLRQELEKENGYTATVGISTNKVLSKLVGNMNKPKSQTTLLPPYEAVSTEESNAVSFMDDHDIGKVPGIGFKMSQSIREHVLGRKASFQEGLVYGGTKEAVSVRDVRLARDMSSKFLEEILGGPGSQKGIGGRVWALLHGIDDSEVSKAKAVPSQISIEDSYIRLDTLEEVRKELTVLSRSLIKRMHVDLTETEMDDDATSVRRWVAHPRTFRLSTRPRPPLNPDGTRPRTFNRISRSFPAPQFLFNFHENLDLLSDKLVSEALIPAFRKLHPERSGWNLSLVNIAVTNMAEAAADSRESQGRDIGKMFRIQDDVLKRWKIRPEIAEDEPKIDEPQYNDGRESHDSDIDTDDTLHPHENLDVHESGWDSDDQDSEPTGRCKVCGVSLPSFAMAAHARFHLIPD